MPSIMYTTQTHKQPVTFRCANPMCRPRQQPGERRLPRFFDFQTADDDPRCPKCTAGPPWIEKRALLHLLLRDPQGPIPGMYGTRWRIACDPKRDYLATQTNGEAVTGDTREVNCPGCRKIIKNAVFVDGSGGVKRLE